MAAKVYNSGLAMSWWYLLWTTSQTGYTTYEGGATKADSDNQLSVCVIRMCHCNIAGVLHAQAVFSVKLSIKTLFPVLLIYTNHHWSVPIPKNDE